MTIKESIVQFLEEQGSWQFAGRVARAVAESHQAKESNVERRMRELEDSGTIERQLVANPAGGNRVVQYRVKSMQKPANLMHWRPEILKAKLISESQKSLL